MRRDLEPTTAVSYRIDGRVEQKLIVECFVATCDEARRDSEIMHDADVRRAFFSDDRSFRFFFLDAAVVDQR